MPERIGRGDLIEQENQDLASGAVAAYRSAVMRAAGWLDAALETGLEFRNDWIEQAQNLLEPWWRSNPAWCRPTLATTSAHHCRR